MGKTDQFVMPHWLTLGASQYMGAEELGGFNERADAVAAADGTDLNEFWQEIQAAIRLRNVAKDRLIDMLSVRVTDRTSEVSMPSEATFEKASEFGQPVGIRAGGVRLWRGYDFDFYDLAIRYTWMFIAQADIAQLRNLNNMALEADTTLVFRKVMTTLFNPLNAEGVTDHDEPVTVYKFYNADGETPPAYKGTTFSSSHNHYLVSGNTAITPANLKTLADSVGEHGYTLQAGYKLVLWINKQEAAIIKTFRVATGAEFDFVPNPNYYGGAVFVPNNGSYVGGPTGTVPGEIGTYGPFHVVEEEYIPAGYVAAIVTGGPNNLQNPIGIREHANPAYRGLKVIPGQRSQYPLLDSFYRRGVGAGIRQRGGGALMQVKASGSFVVPAAYTTV
jgi:hypothetical protein